MRQQYDSLQAVLSHPFLTHPSPLGPPVGVRKCYHTPWFHHTPFVAPASYTPHHPSYPRYHTPPQDNTRGDIFLDRKCHHRGVVSSVCGRQLLTFSFSGFVIHQLLDIYRRRLKSKPQAKNNLPLPPPSPLVASSQRTTYGISLRQLTKKGKNSVF